MSEMHQAHQDGARLYLDDLQVGQRFTSGTYLIEGARIKEFAAECPGAQTTEEALQLPVYSRLRASDVERVVRVVRKVVADLAPLDNQDKVQNTLRADARHSNRQASAS